jgi:hypothetical protein
MDGSVEMAESMPVAVPLKPEEALAVLGLPDLDAVRGFFPGFENLGGNCEFGLVQRHFGAEPLSLLRWTATPPEASLFQRNVD